MIKATYHLDSKEPKEKHVMCKHKFILSLFLDIIECLRGAHQEVSPKETFNLMFERYLKNLSSWSLTTKTLVIMHRCLTDTQLCSPISNELKCKEHLLHPFQKKASDESYEGKMYYELSVLYINYLKFLFNFKIKNKILNIRMSEVSAKVKAQTIGEIFLTYESFDALITQIFNIFEHQTFCKRTRLYTNVIFMLFADLIQIYKVFYVVVTELLERFADLTVD